MRLPRNDLGHLSSVAHQGKHILFGIDPDRAIHYCVKRDAPQETALGFRLTPEVLVDLRARPDVQTRLDGLEGRHFATQDLFVAAVTAALGKDVADKLLPELLRRASLVAVSHWADWQMLPLPHDAADESVVAFEQERRMGGLVTSLYDSHKDTALAPVQAVSDGAHLHIFRQSVRGTLLADRFVLDPDAGRLARALEVRFKRSRRRYAPLGGASGQELDSRDFRDVHGAFFLEPTRELHLVGRLVEGRFAVVLVPTHEHDHLRWHIFSWDPDQRRLRSTTLRRTADTPFDVRDYTIVEGDGEERTYRQIPGILRRTFDLRARDGAALEVTGALTAAVHDIQREIEGEDGELQPVKVERRVFLAAVTAADCKLAGLEFALHADGSLAPIETRRVDVLLRERNEELQLPSDLLDTLVTCHDDTREAPPAKARRGLCFDGGDPWAEGRAAIALGDAFTIEVWARAQTPGRDEVVLGHGEGGVDRGLHLAFRADRRFRFGFFDNDLTSPEPCVDGEWHHWACVNTKDRVRRIFRDGVLLAEDRSATPYRGEGALILGKARWGQPFDGEIADVRVWRVARSEAEIRADMRRRLTGGELGVVAQWPLEALVAGVVRNTVPRGHDIVVHGAWRRGCQRSRRLADAVTQATGYRNDTLLAIAERSTYVETLELRTDGDSGEFDFVFWGETVRGAATERVRVPAQIEPLPGGWKRATARFTAGVGMTRLRAFEISAPAGTWTRIELRNHRIERLVGAVTEATHVDVVALTELAPEQDTLERVQAVLDALERQEAELARRLRWLEATLNSDPNARATTVAQIRGEVARLAAETQARADERAVAEGSLSYKGTLALRAANGINDLFLRVHDTHVDAISHQAGPWETLTIVHADNPGHEGVVHYGDFVALKAHTGKYLIADNTLTGETHYYWVTAVYPAIGAYEKWQIFDPANLGARGPVPRGGRVALLSWRGDNGRKFVTSGTAGPWWQKTWCEHDTIRRDANFTAMHLAEGPSVAAARAAHASAASRLSSRNADLATAERLASEATRDRAHVERERAAVQAQLDALRVRIDSEVAAHLAAARRLADAPLTMPRVSPDGQPLAVLGGLLSFARAAGRPAAYASLEGALNLQFPGTDGRLRRCTYDAVSQRWDTDTPTSCLRFDGTGAVTIPHDPTFSSEVYTIELWFRWHGDAGIQFLTAKGYEELEIHLGGGTTGSLRFIPAPGIYVDTAAHAIKPGAWVHVACVYSARTGEAQIYLDGAAAAQRRNGSAATISANTAPIQLGRRCDGDCPFSGQMSEVRLWSVALTQEEIVAHMQHRLTGFEPGLAGYWPLRDGDGATARDLSRRQLHGTVAGPRFYPSTSPMGRALAGVVPCLTFARAGSVVVPHSPAYSSSSFTAELWIRWSGSGQDIDFLLGKGLEELEIHTGGNVPGGLRFIPAAGVYIDTAPDALTPGEWVHVACVFAGDPNGAEIYLNGVAMTRTRTDRQLARNHSTAPLTIGARNGASSPFSGAISEVRLWRVALTQAQILARMYQPLTGREADLLGYWPLRDGEGPRALDLSPAANHGTIVGPRFLFLDSPRERPPVGLRPPDTVLAGEYDSLEGDGAVKQAYLRRFLAWRVGGGVEVVMGRRVDTLEMRWLGNAQMNPTLVGYIEGAPPVPSENLTVEDNYNGASSVEFKVSEENTTTFTHDLSAGANVLAEGALGVSVKGELGVAFLAKLSAEFEATGQIKGKLGGGLTFLNQHTRSGTSTVTTSETLALKGEREKVARFPGLGLRFIPKNVGYATVVSTMADIFVLRLRGSRRMVSYRMRPVKDVPPDVNTVTFLINPAYTMNGSLDGQVGTSAADARFYGHVPATRAQYGSQLEASYFRLREAYALKDAIDRSNRKAEMLAINLKSDILDGIDRDLQTQTLPKTREGIEQQAQQKAEGVTEAAAAGMKKPPAPRKIEQVIEDTPKGNIVNSYVWDGDGGLRVQAQSFASSWTNVFGGSVNAEFGLGLGVSVRAGVAFDFDAMLGFNLTETLTNTTSTTRALELNVSVDCERRDITDNRDRPVYPGEKVDRYRFMSFALEPATDHFADFFARVVDPEWLRSDDEEARVLRQIDQGRPNKTWRVLHRVTYVERPSRGGNGDA